jgi:hypothetical protein
MAAYMLLRDSNIVLTGSRSVLQGRCTSGAQAGSRRAHGLMTWANAARFAPALRALTSRALITEYSAVTACYIPWSKP